MELSAENLSKYFPYYLTAERKEGLLRALKDVPNRRYYATIADPEPLQGDGWRGVEVLRFEDGHRDWVQGLVLSNSCDLAADNSRLLPAKLNFAPLIVLQRYVDLLRANRISEMRIEGHLVDVRAQKISDIFFLPEDPILGPERIALLQDVHTIPLNAWNLSGKTARIFSLSDIGFYLFVFKLSVHFCRLHENINRAQ